MQGNLPEVKGVKFCRCAFLLAVIGSLLLVLPGCEQSSEPADSTLTQSTQSTQSTESTESTQSIQSTQTTPTKAGWITNYEQGQQEAKAGNKLVLLDFTGSDWCGWCILLDREVFSKPKFKEYASKNLVLVELDFPKMKPVPAATRAENERLALKYRVQAFPTIIVLNGDGQVVGALGYVQGGPDAFIAVLEKMRKG